MEGQLRGPGVHGPSRAQDAQGQGTGRGARVLGPEPCQRSAGFTVPIGRVGNCSALVEQRALTAWLKPGAETHFLISGPRLGQTLSPPHACE